MRRAPFSGPAIRRSFFRAGLSGGLLAFCLPVDSARAQNFYGAPTSLPTYTENGQAYVSSAAPLPLPEAGLLAQFIGTESFTYDTNPLLITSGAKSLFGSVTTPELILTDSTEASKVSLDTTLDENVFNRHEFDSTDVHELASGTHRNDQWQYDAKGTIDYDTTRTSEITTFGINLPAIRHTGLGITPDISYSPTEVDKLSLQGSAATSQYDNQAFVSYDFYTATPTYEHNFDPLNAGIFSIQAQRYEARNSGRQVNDSIGPSFGWLSALTPRLSLLFTTGVEETTRKSIGTNGASLNSSSLDYVFSGNLKFTGQQDSAEAIIARQQSPFSNGTEALLTSFSLSETHALNTRFSLVVTGAYENADYPQTTGINLGSQFSAGGGVVYHASEHLDVSANYQYKSEKLTNAGSNILDSSVILSLIFHPMGAAL